MTFDRVKTIGMDTKMTESAACDGGDEAIAYLNTPEYTMIPGFCDVHVHFREPGFSYKETIHSGSMAAARGGFTTVCTMPNLSPVPDSAENLMCQMNIIKRDAIIDVLPYGAITVGEKGKDLSDMEGMSGSVIAFSDDGKGVSNDEVMRRAMQTAKRLGKVIAAHCEDETLICGGYIHDGEYARLNGHRGIPSESEWRQIERDIRLVRETGCDYHVCHISSKESVELIRRAKAEGLPVTCETAPHYLTMCDGDIIDDGRFRMNPPIRGKADRDALIEGILDGTITIIATDHAPHSRQEKSGGLAGSLFGVVGLETAFPVLYTKLVRTGIITLEKLIELMAINPRKRFKIPANGDFSLWILNEEYTVNSEEFLSMGRSTPFDGMKVFGKCVLTVHNGRVVYR